MGLIKIFTLTALFIIVGCLVILMAGCAPAPHQSTAWSMTWRCGSQACCNHMVPYSCGGSGSFSNETDCLAWETVFLNGTGYPYNTVTACTGN